MDLCYMGSFANRRMQHRRPIPIAGLFLLLLVVACSQPMGTLTAAIDGPSTGKVGEEIELTAVVEEKATDDMTWYHWTVTTSQGDEAFIEYFVPTVYISAEEATTITVDLTVSRGGLSATATHSVVVKAP